MDEVARAKLALVEPLRMVLYMVVCSLLQGEGHRAQVTLDRLFTRVGQLVTFDVPPP